MKVADHLQLIKRLLDGLIVSALKQFQCIQCSVRRATTVGGIYLHQASNKVRGGLSFSRDQTLSEFGETAVGHNSQRCMDFLQDTQTHSHHTSSALSMR